MIYEYKDLKNRIKVGDTVRAVEGKKSGCGIALKTDGSNSRKVIAVTDSDFKIEGCLSYHLFEGGSFLEIVNEKKSWETLESGDYLIDNSGTKRKILAVSGLLAALDYSGTGDSLHDWFIIKNLKNGNWTIEQPPAVPEEIVMTIPEIEAKLGVTNLKIKKE